MKFVNVHTCEGVLQYVQKVDDLPLKIIGETIASMSVEEFIELAKK